MRTSILIIFIFFTGLKLSAHEYLSPFPMEFFSQNRLYRLMVYPRTVPKNYERELRKRNKSPEKYRNIPFNDSIRPCRAILYKKNGIGDFDLEEIWEVELENSTMLDYAFVPNDGSFIITVDEYFNKGRSENDFVVYDKNGGLLKKYYSYNIIPYKFQGLHQTEWFVGIEHISIKPHKINILVHDRNFNIKKVVYNLSKMEFEK